MNGADEPAGLVLTAHPLQRVGAYAIAALVSDAEPEQLSGVEFAEARELMTDQAVAAALVRDSKAVGGFWLKASYSLFPNSPMNHPRNRNKSEAEIRAAIVFWRSESGRTVPPGTCCALCGRPASGFFGKLDVPLAQSESYRNSTPRGHEGLALCRPCVECFRALPYGSHLTGGASYALHSWDEGFMCSTVRRQVERNVRIAAVGKVTENYAAVREVVALRALRGYDRRLASGVELLVFNNNNRGQSLEIHSLEQPLAEWLRKSMRPSRKSGFNALVWAHQSHQMSGVVGLARNAFGEPARILTSGVRYLGRAITISEPDHERLSALAALLLSFVTEVMQMNEKDLGEIRATAHRIAGLLCQAESGGKLNTLRAHMRDPRKLRTWLTRHAVQWAIHPPEGSSGPLVSERAMVLLFDPSPNNVGWFHRDVLLIGVLEELSRLGWRSKNPEEDLEELEDLTDAEFIKDMEEDL
jgi:hypothetical protein